MPIRGPEDIPGTGADADRFVVFVEGPRDRDILRSWARQISHELSRRLVASTVILGGRQPARAATHLRALSEQGVRARGLCVLDRDGGTVPQVETFSDVDLELFTWGRRHIESYLLVPEAIRRGLRVRNRDGHLERVLQRELPHLDDEQALRQVDAKRLLQRNGPLARFIGRPVDPGRIARAMRPEELHPEVRALLSRLREGLGLDGPEAPVTLRARGPDPP